MMLIMEEQKSTRAIQVSSKKQVVPEGPLSNSNNSNGSFGSSVILCTINGLERQVKVAAKIDTRTAEEEKEKERRLGYLMSNHPYFITYYFHVDTTPLHYQFMEYLNNGDLFDIAMNGPMPETVMRLFAAEIFLAIKALHAKGIAHRDLKLENIGIGYDGHIR